MAQQRIVTRMNRWLNVFIIFIAITVLSGSVSAQVTQFILVDTLDLPEGMSPSSGQLSKDGLEYYISMKIGSAKAQLFVMQREDLEDPFEDTLSLGSKVNAANKNNHFPTITADKKILVFSVGDAYLSNDLYIAYRSDSTAPFDSVRDISEVNITDAAEVFSWISPDGLALYFTRAYGSITDSILLSKRSSVEEEFGSPELVLIHPDADKSYYSSWFSDDQLEIYCSRKPGSETRHAARTSVDQDFSDPQTIYGFEGTGNLTSFSMVENMAYVLSAPASATKLVLIYERHDNVPIKNSVPFNQFNVSSKNSVLLNSSKENCFYNVLGQRINMNFIEEKGFYSIPNGCFIIMDENKNSTPLTIIK